ncbi:achaete-scute complex protein T3-like [Arctopsyche grandis]|uniref:achaete-scute complex protein T3-like n=1 Tax=Arctopsyche grandis TaxID=121162 RepID=UPI00406D8E9E
MLNEIHVLPNGQNNCVIVPNGYQQQQSHHPAKATDKRAIPIAPAPAKMNHQQQPDLMRCRKKVTYKQPFSGYQSASIIRRNARERNRVKQVNDGFAALRKHLPPAVVAALSSNAARGGSKKLSKVDTLKMVVEYIRYLQQVLDESDENLELCSDDKNENQENNAYYAATTSQDMQRLDHGYLLDQTPPCSESSASPAPSFSSEVSSGISGYTMNCFPIDKYDAPINPMDEELLDVISWWQQK